MDINGPQTTELPPDYLVVMLPELLRKNQITAGAHQRILDVLSSQGLSSAISILCLIMSTKGGNF